METKKFIELLFKKNGKYADKHLNLSIFLRVEKVKNFSYDFTENIL